jgi:hypothetical protein
MEFQICCSLSIISFGAVFLVLFPHLIMNRFGEIRCRQLHEVINVWTKAASSQNTRLSFQEQLLKDIKIAGIKLPGMAYQQILLQLFFHIHRNTGC